MDNLTLALWITLGGMGIVFAAILLLWGMMAALTAILPEKPAQDAGSPSGSPQVEDPVLAFAAAAAVAVALSQIDGPIAHPIENPPPNLVGAWQLMMRTRQMYQKGPRGRR